SRHTPSRRQHGNLGRNREFSPDANWHEGCTVEYRYQQESGLPLLVEAAASEGGAAPPTSSRLPLDHSATTGVAKGGFTMRSLLPLGRGLMEPSGLFPRDFMDLFDRFFSE